MNGFVAVSAYVIPRGKGLNKEERPSAMASFKSTVSFRVANAVNN